MLPVDQHARVALARGDLVGGGILAVDTSTHLNQLMPSHVPSGEIGSQQRLHGVGDESESTRHRSGGEVFFGGSYESAQRPVVFSLFGKRLLTLVFGLAGAAHTLRDSGVVVDDHERMDLQCAQHRERDHHVVVLAADRRDADPCQRQIVLLCAEALQDRGVLVAFHQNNGFGEEGFWKVLEAELIPPAPDRVLLDVPVEPFTDGIETRRGDPGGCANAVLRRTVVTRRTSSKKRGSTK